MRLLSFEFIHLALIPWTGICFSFFLAPFIAAFVLRKTYKGSFRLFILRLFFYSIVTAGIFLAGVYWSHGFQMNAFVFIETGIEFFSTLFLSWLIGIILLRYVQKCSYRYIVNFFLLSFGISVLCTALIVVSWPFLCKHLCKF